MYESYSPECNDGILENGYWAGTYWVPRFISKEEWYTKQPPYTSGKLVWYAPGVMEANILQREEWGQLEWDEKYIDGVALMSPAHLGDEVWIKINGTWEGPFVVADCAQQDDMWWLLGWNKEVVEVGWETKTRLEIKGPIEVEVLVGNPWDIYRLSETGQKPIHYPTWWIEGKENENLGTLSREFP